MQNTVYARPGHGKRNGIVRMGPGLDGRGVVGHHKYPPALFTNEANLVKNVVVVGGGDSAIDEGLFLTKFASLVNVVHRRDRLRANANLQNRALNNDKMNFIWDSVVEEVLGEDQVTGVRLKNVKTGEENIFNTDGVFVFIGHIANTEVFKDKIEMNEQNIIITNKRQQTSVPGVFAAGDVQDPIYRQAITSAGTGAIAAMEAEKFIAELEGTAYPGK